MPTETPRALVEIRYYDAAQEYLRNLPLEHFMQATPQATQRKITLESFDPVHARRPEFQAFNELLVQYPLPRKKRPGQVVPDNMVVIHSEPIVAEGSYDVPLQPVKPFWMLEYVSKSNKRKDYDDNMRKYEPELKVPYFLLFVPSEQELTLHRHKGKKYVSVKPDENERYAIPEIDMELALLNGWVRYWYQGELLPLPADLLMELDATRQQLDHANKQLVNTKKRLHNTKQQLENAKHQLDNTKERLDTTQSQLDEERRARNSAEAEMLKLKAELNRHSN